MKRKAALKAEIDYALGEIEKKDWLSKKQDMWKGAGSVILDNSNQDFVLEAERNFEILCASLVEMGYAQPKAMTTKEFYATVEFIELKKENNKDNGGNSVRRPVRR